jgi:glycosyltransferase involved in cell wall biosynthesis
MFISTIIPTIGRESLSRAVYSVLNQEFVYEEHEVIVVNDSGKELPKEDWQSSVKVKIIDTNCHNRSVARNTGAAIAQGRFLHFLDDDDWLLPGAFNAFWQAKQSCTAAWYCGSFRSVNNQGEKIVDIYPTEKGNCYIQLISWEWLPLQASFIETNAFFTVGGFSSLISLMGGFEDIDLSRKIVYSSEVALISQLICCIRIGDNESTTDYVNLFIQNRQSRENALNKPGSWSRMLASIREANSNQAYWSGKLVYNYMTSIPWNIERRRFSICFSRLFWVLLSLLVGWKYFLERAYWKGLITPHHPLMRRLVEETEIQLFTQTNWK